MRTALQFGVVPARITASLYGLTSLPAAGLTLLTAVFLHGGWTHLLGNMLYLWIFGDNVEDRLGSLTYLIFYLGAGIIASIAQITIDPTSTTPVIGASGAIAGVLGAYVITFPRAKVQTLLILIVYITIIQVPASVFIVLWFVLQVLSGFVSLSSGVVAVAWWAHIGGFLAGMVLMTLLPKRKISQPEPDIY